MIHNDTIEKIQEVTKDFRLHARDGYLIIRFGYWQEFDISRFSHIPEIKFAKEHIDTDDDCGDLWAYRII